MNPEQIRQEIEELEEKITPRALINAAWDNLEHLERFVDDRQNELERTYIIASNPEYAALQGLWAQMFLLEDLTNHLDRHTWHSVYQVVMGHWRDHVEAATHKGWPIP